MAPGVMAQEQGRRSLWPRRWERPHYVSLLVAVVGLLVMALVAGRFAADEVTTLAFGVGPTAPKVAVPVRAFVTLLGLYYLVAGVVAFVATPRRVASALLVGAGLLLFPAVLVVSAAGKQTNVLTMIVESLRLATPIALGSLAGLWSERSGIVNIAVEGMMLMGACLGFTAFFFLEGTLPSTGLALFLSVMVAVLTGALMALLHGWLSITFKTDQIVSGTVINILALGVTAFIRRQYLLNSRAGRVTLPTIHVPALENVPLLGPLFLADNPILPIKPIFLMMFILLALSHFVLFHTTWGLRTRAVGEHPKAADTVGIDVIRIRYLNVLLSGMIAGLAGAWFSLETVGAFDDNMTNGKGFIALAALIFGKWTPFGAFGGALLFGFSEALGTRFQLLNVPVPNQFLQILPYVVTIVVTSGLIGRAVAPAAIGQPYEKG